MNEATRNLKFSVDMAAFRASITDRDREILVGIARQLREAGIEPTTEAFLDHPAASEVKARWALALKRHTRIVKYEEPDGNVPQV